MVKEPTQRNLRSHPSPTMARQSPIGTFHWWTDLLYGKPCRWRSRV